MPINISMNMNLPVPQVGVEAGPQYATDVNNCLTLIDQHNHSAGQGVQINPNGININSDLPFNNNNLTLARSLRLSPQVANLSDPTDLGCLYESGVDLYFNDGLGNQVRITQAGGVAGSPGSISNLTPPASVTYVSGNSTFVFESNATTAANLDAASIILRNLTPNSSGVTISAPSALGADYTIVLPLLPAVTSVVTIDNAGNMGTQTYDQVGQNMTSVGANAIANTRTRATGTTVAAGGVAVSTSSGTFTVNSPVPATVYPVTNLTVTITTTGRPVFISCQSDGVIVPSHFRAETGASIGLQMIIKRGSTTISNVDATIGSAVGLMQVPASSVMHVDAVAAGTYTYTISISQQGTADLIGATGIVLTAYEL